jgi:hypothetical protein
MFKKAKCPKCLRIGEIMISNNPLIEPICFSCITKELDATNINHADFFCRTYNIPFDPELWLNTASKFGQRTFYEYSLDFFTNNKENLFYTTTTADLWKAVNEKWQSNLSYAEILNRIEPLKLTYLERSKLKWGDIYTFEEFIKLDSVYTATLKSNNITNPIQKEAVKTLLKIQIEINKAIMAGDTKAVKDFSTAYGTFTKTAQLEDMVDNTRTDEITTVADLYDFMEKQGFQFKFYDNYDRDEVDITIKDINETNRRLIIDSTGIGPLLEQMVKARQDKNEQDLSDSAYQELSLEELLSFSPEMEVAVEDDSDIIDEDLEG